MKTTFFTKVLLASTFFNFALCTLNLEVSTVHAGGLLTNTNQSAAFIRNPSRDAVIDIDGVYMNPAGVNFMNPGFHFNLSWQNAKQSRDITTTFPTLAQNVDYVGQASRKYHGKALAPVIPSFQLAYVWDKWTVSGGFGLGGGGGKCEFDNGLGSFEVPYSALISSTMKNMGLTTGGYSLDAWMKGRQYYFGLQVGAGYKIHDNVSVYLGLRAVYATCNYNGYVRNIQLYQNAADKSTLIPDAYLQSLGINLQNYDITLDTDQSDLGWTPILGIDWKINKHWNLAAKYEFETHMNLKNHTKKLSPAAQQIATIDRFNENKTGYIAEDIPSILTVGAQYTPIDKVRLMAGWHFYFDRESEKYNHEEKNIKKGTMELSAGAEWDVIKQLTVSAGWQTTRYRLGDSYMQDLSFNTTNNMLCAGVRIHATERVSFDLGYMHTFYKSHDVTTPDYQGSGIDKKDHYIRSNRVIAAGVNIDF